MIMNDFCALEQLSIEIGLLYKRIPHCFELDELEVRNIREQVEAGTYCFSPLRVRLCPPGGKIDPRLYHKMRCEEYPNNTIVVIPEESDLLVLTALGILINNVFLDKGINSIRMDYISFYDELHSRENVDLLYRVDLTRSLLTIEKSTLIKKLESVLGKNPIFDLVVSFLSIGYINNEFEEVNLYDTSIPPAGLLTNVLHNVILTELDNEIANLYPSINYSRHIHEVYISNCGELSAKEISLLIIKLGLAGIIYVIRPGYSAYCFVGGIGIDHSGKIYVEYGSRNE